MRRTWHWFAIGLFALSSVAHAGPVFRNNPTQLTAYIGELFSIDLRTLLSNQGTGTLTWSIIGPKPAWLSLDSPNNRLSGVPSLTDAGLSTFTLAVQDNDAGALTQVQMTVKGRPVWSQNPINLGDQPEGAPFSFDLRPFVSHTAGLPVTFSALNLPSWMSISSSGVLSGTPGRPNVGNYSGIVLTATDTLGESSSVNAFGRVLKVIRPPSWVANPITLPNANDNQLYSQNVVAFVLNPEMTPLTFSITGGPAWLSMRSAGVLSGTPLQSNVGPVSEQGTVSTVIDGMPFSATTTFQFNVVHVNRAPRWLQDPTALPGGITSQPYSQDLRAYAVDDDTGDSITFSKISGPAWATVSPSGILSGTPALTDQGVNTFVLRVSDGSLFDDATVTIRLLKENEPPRWTQDPVLLPNGVEDAAYSQSLLGFVTDPDGDPLRFTKISGPAWLSVATNGTVSGTPRAADLGLNDFVVQVSDNISGSANATVRIRVVHVNHPPSWTQNPIPIAATEDSALSFTLSSFATDPDIATVGDSLTFSLISGPAWLSISAAGLATGTPRQADVGSRAATARVTDAAGVAADVTLNLTVTNVNDAPFCAQNPITLPSARQGSFYSTSLVPFASDEDGTTPSFSKLSGPAWMAVSSAGLLTGTPGTGDSGQQTLTFRLTDPQGATGDCVARVTVAVNGAPNVPPITIQVRERETKIVELTSFITDPENDPLTFSATSPLPSWITLTPSGQLTLRPLHSNLGTHTLQLQVSDGFTPVPFSVRVEVLRDPRPPVWSQNPIRFTATVAEPFSQTLADKVSDPDGDPLSFSKQSGPAWLVVGADGSLTGTPQAADLGLNTFLVRASNGSASADVTVLIDVVDPNTCNSLAGKPDGSFGEGGTVLARDYKFQDTVVRNDGKIYATGYLNRNGKQVVTARYLSNGDPDPAFGSNGAVITDLEGTEEIAYGIASFGDRVCVAGTVKVTHSNRQPATGGSCGANLDLFVICYRDDGSLDPSFAGDGIRYIDVDQNKNDEGRDIAFDSQGRIVVAGLSEARVSDTGDSQRENVLSIRLLQNGDLDSSYGNGGIVLTDLSRKKDVGDAVIVDAQGRIVVGGYTEANATDSMTRHSSSCGHSQRKNALVLRYLSNGALDTTFNGRGYQITDLNEQDDVVTSVAAYPNGDVIAAGWTVHSQNRGLLIRYDSAGVRMPSFGTNGVVVTNFGLRESYLDVTLQSDGKIVASGEIKVNATQASAANDRAPATGSGLSGSVVLLARYFDNGTLDDCFGNGGKWIDLGNLNRQARGVALQPADGKILVAGDEIVQRYNGGRRAVNQPPSVALLVAPLNGAEGVKRPVLFAWHRSTDPEGTQVRYELFVCANADFSGCGTPIWSDVGDLVATEAGLWIWGLLLLLGIGLKKRARLARLIPILVVLAVALSLSSCGGDSKTPQPEKELTVTVGALQAGTRYYWKVRAHDDKGRTSESEVRTFLTE